MQEIGCWFMLRIHTRSWFCHSHSFYVPIKIYDRHTNLHKQKRTHILCNDVLKPLATLLSDTPAQRGCQNEKAIANLFDRLLLATAQNGRIPGR